MMLPKHKIMQDDVKERLEFFENVLDGKNLFDVQDPEIKKMFNDYLESGENDENYYNKYLVPIDYYLYIMVNVHGLYDEQKAKVSSNSGIHVFKSVQQTNRSMAIIDTFVNYKPDQFIDLINKLKKPSEKSEKIISKTIKSLKKIKVDFLRLYESNAVYHVEYMLKNTRMLDLANVMIFIEVVYRDHNKCDLPETSRKLIQHMMAAMIYNDSKETQMFATFNLLAMLITGIKRKKKPVEVKGEIAGFVPHIEFNNLYLFIENPDEILKIIKNSDIDVTHLSNDKYKKDGDYNRIIQSLPIDTFSKIHMIEYYYKTYFTEGAK